jgi:hypothetical protein
MGKHVSLWGGWRKQGGDTKYSFEARVRCGIGFVGEWRVYIGACGTSKMPIQLMANATQLPCSYVYPSPLGSASYQIAILGLLAGDTH